jgi:hypothetical protein
VKTNITYLPFSNKTYKVGDVSFNKHVQNRTYLVLDSQRDLIQNNMESRAVNIILRRIIGEETFCY